MAADACAIGDAAAPAGLDGVTIGMTGSGHACATEGRTACAVAAARTAMAVVVVDAGAVAAPA